MFYDSDVQYVPMGFNVC